LILAKEEILPGIYRITFEVPVLFINEAQPGRFIQLEVSHDSFPVTRRPFTISSISGSSVEIVFETVGRGTGILAETDIGRSLRLLGPLGSGYRLNPGKWLLIGGGLGAAGFPGLAASIECDLLLLGASSRDKLLTIPGTETVTITEDGSSGRKGMITDLLETVRWESFSSIALCGPVPMMKAVIEMMPLPARANTQVSAEARMGCGWGACEGCSVPKTGGGFLKCCSDGPVFPADSIDWERWEGIH
jgi:dihydroorotate dehydrogenase electron transfer subunit